MSILLENINVSAYQYQQAVIPHFRSICDPLFNLGVKWFGYIKIFGDGSYLLLAPCNNEFIKKYFLTIKSQGTSPTIQIESSPIGQSYHVMFPSNISLFNRNKDPVLHLLHTCDIWPVYAIYKNGLDFVEAYCFGMNKTDEYAPQFYFKNMLLLEHFCLYFAEKASDLIDHQDTKKLAYFDQKFTFITSHAEDEWTKNAEQFLNQTQLQRLHLIEKNYDILLSKRETECLRHLAFGKSAKEIGRTLNLSHRTIETYINKIKVKTGFNNKIDIINSYLKNAPCAELNYPQQKIKFALSYSF